MWFDIDWNKFGVENLPSKWRDVHSIEFLKVIIKPINELYYKWYNWRIDNVYKLEHTSQVCSLEGSLNDKFDPVERRIYIGDGLVYDTLYIFTEAEEQTVWMHTEAENEILWLRTESETADTGLDFIVYVPQELYNDGYIMEGLKAHVKFYKAGGKRFNIFIDE
jgi:hypothetical protein